MDALPPWFNFHSRYFVAIVVRLVFGGYLVVVLPWRMLCRHRRAGFLGGCFLAEVALVFPMAAATAAGNSSRLL